MLRGCRSPAKTVHVTARGGASPRRRPVSVLTAPVPTSWPRRPQARQFGTRQRERRRGRHPPGRRRRSAAASACHRPCRSAGPPGGPRPALASCLPPRRPAACPALGARRRPPPAMPRNCTSPPSPSGPVAATATRASPAGAVRSHNPNRSIPAPRSATGMPRSVSNPAATRRSDGDRHLRNTIPAASGDGAWVIGAPASCPAGLAARHRTRAKPTPSGRQVPPGRLAVSHPIERRRRSSCQLKHRKPGLLPRPPRHRLDRDRIR
jgi:hypothetical protein